MLHQRPHLRLGFLIEQAHLFDQALGHRFDFAALGGHMPLDLLTDGGDLLALLDARITRVGKDFLLLTVEQGMGLGVVRHVRCGAAETVRQPGSRIHADVRLHAEIPMVIVIKSAIP
jgi:hypothetical protein